MSGHTPGPWTNHGRIAQPGLPHSSVAAKTLIARVYSEAFGDSEQETANARLIAAAPELLQALKDAVSMLDDLRFKSDADQEGAVTEQIQEANSVIAKATGEPA